MMHYTITGPMTQAPGRVKTFASRTIDNFRQDKSGYESLNTGMNGSFKGRHFNAKAAALNTANAPLVKELRNRHLQMIAIGGSIGTGLFIGSGAALSTGGPASLTLAYVIMGAVIFCTVQALGEMGTIFPISGSFNAYSTRFLDPAWGFAMGWNYALQWMLIMPLEIMAASLTLNYWHSSIPPGVAITLILFVLTAINLSGVKAYGESESLLSIVKVVAVIGFILLGAIINCVGTNDSGYIGGKYWKNPGAFNNGFRGFCSVLVIAAFAFSGTELVGLAAAESYNPSKSIPTAVKQVFWRITIFYVGGVTVVGLLVPYDNPSLPARNMVDTSASPFVVAIRDAGIRGLDSVMNAVIMIAVLSVANSSFFASSRTLVSLARQGQAPSILGYIDRKGRPLVSIALTCCFGVFAYLALTPVSGPAFTWMLATSGLSTMFTWAGICIAHARFRAAWLLQGHSLDDLAYVSPMGAIGSWIGFVVFMLVLVAQIWVALFPVGSEGFSTAETMQSFFSTALALPVVLLCWAGYKIWFRTHWIRIEDIDLTSGRHKVDAAMLPINTKEERGTWPMWKVVYRSMC